MDRTDETPAAIAARNFPYCPACDRNAERRPSCKDCSGRYQSMVASLIGGAVDREWQFRGQLIEDIRELVGLVYENPRAGWGKTQDEMLSWIRRFIEEQHNRISPREMSLRIQLEDRTAEVERLQADLATAEKARDLYVNLKLGQQARAEQAETLAVAAEERGREAEREACAMLAGNIYPDLGWPLNANFAIRDRIARAIRARAK